MHVLSVSESLLKASNKPVLASLPVDTGITSRHWQLLGDGGCSWLVFNRADSDLNLLTVDVFHELEGIVSHLEANPPKTLVLRSSKVSGFCGGADISIFREYSDTQRMTGLMLQAHSLFDRFAALPCRKIAVLHGVCLGGGLELALLCDYRFAIKGARLGFPEVRLGLHPGLGGSWRSVQLLGPLRALNMMLDGREVSASSAKKIGLVDVVVEERHLESALSEWKGASKRARRWRDRLANLACVRPILAKIYQHQVSKRVNLGHYPSPLHLLRLWRDHGGVGREQGPAEIASFAGLTGSELGANLNRIYFLRESLRSHEANTERQLQHIHVIGAGVMGGDIAVWAALRGFQVSLSDPDPAMIGKTLQRAQALRQVKRLSVRERQAMFDRLLPDIDGHGIARADIVIEVAPEREEIKGEIYRTVSQSLRTDSLLVSNTSSLSVGSLSRDVDDPSRFMGLHFFNPVASMQLVELVHHDGVSDECRNLCRLFALALGKLPVVVQDRPGFLVNRILTPYLLEAILLADEGASLSDIDGSMLAFGMPMGPLELVDRVGLDICLAVADSLRTRVPEPLPRVPDWIRDKVQSGNLGRKSGQGFYDWRKSPPKHGGQLPPMGTSVGTMRDRLLLTFLNAVVRCRSEKIVANDEQLDAAVVFGTGFAPFLGGPLHYIQAQDVPSLVEKLSKLTASHGERFQADSGWKSLF